jgi:hypothetical protein
MVKQLKPPLRAVKASERAPQRRKLSVTQAAEGGSHAELLDALQRRLAGAMMDPVAHPRDLAALARQITAIAAELEATKARAEEGPVGQAAATADEPFQIADI